MKKLILTTATIAVLAVAPATASAQAEEPACTTKPGGGGAITRAYHDVHLVPEPFVEGTPLAQVYEETAHDFVECEVIAANDPTE